MEKEIRYELLQVIPELEDNIYPTNAPEESAKPYLVYYLDGGEDLKTLEGYLDHGECHYLFSCMAKRYSDMKDFTSKIEQCLKTFPGRAIGEDENLLIQDIQIRKPKEVWEPELKLNRGIIDCIIYY